MVASSTAVTILLIPVAILILYFIRTCHYGIPLFPLFPWNPKNRKHDLQPVKTNAILERISRNSIIQTNSDYFPPPPPELLHHKNLLSQDGQQKPLRYAPPPPLDNNEILYSNTIQNSSPKLLSNRLRPAAIPLKRPEDVQSPSRPALPSRKPDRKNLPKPPVVHNEKISALLSKFENSK